ncbi:MAG: tyrosine-protein phosphatase [Pseudonocardia sp.]|nr:tyrosine-protein phosphatase [Pseudonocardia sp.]
MSGTRKSYEVVPSWLWLESALNLRDVGGLPVVAGGYIRPKTLLRSGSLRQLSAADAATLISEFGLHTVVDLRTPGELAADGPSALARAGIATMHLPLVADVEEALRRVRGGVDAVPTMTLVYQEFLGRRGEHLVTVARLVAWRRTGSVLVHCAAGKDRTGVATAILLDAVGADRAAVIADYVASNEVIEHVLATLAGFRGNALALSAIPLALRMAQPEAMRAILDQLDRDYGGAAGWLCSRGLDPAELELLRRRLVRLSSEPNGGEPEPGRLPHGHDNGQ